MKNTTEKTAEKKKGLFHKILFVGIIPLFVIISIVLLVLTVSGINVFQEAEKIPLIGSIFHSKDSASASLDIYEDQINKLQANLKNEEAKVKELELEIERKDQEIATLTEENNSLAEEMDSVTNSASNEEMDKADKPDSLVKTYETMAPKNAAAILIQMDEQIALDLLADMKDETLAEILEKMPAKNAAAFTSKLVERNNP